MRITVTGIDKFAGLSRRLADAADHGLGDQLRQAIEHIEPGLRESLRSSALRTLPKRGGLNRVIADTPIVTRWDITGDTVGFTLTARSRYNVSRINYGRVVHPLFGDRRHWYTESVTPGWWSTPITEAEPKAREGVQGAMDTVARQIEGAA